MTLTNRADDPLTADDTRLRTLPWRKSTRSGGNDNDCVELALDGGDFLVRDSKQSWDEGPILRVPTGDLAAIKHTLNA